MSNVEHRAARATKADKTYNTLDLYPGPKFAILELLDDKDSAYLRRTIVKKGFVDVTPAVGRNMSTYYWHRPDPGNIDAYKSIKPEWFYLSGHYARTVMLIPNNHVLVPLPTGFFNEPFHKAEWESVWNHTKATSFFLQTEIHTAATRTKFEEGITKYWHRSPYGPSGTAKDTTDRKKVIDEWMAVWDKPSADLKVHTTDVPAMRGLVCANTWPDVKVLLLVGCNTLSWRKEAYTKAFPNALVLGYIGKNPANAVPHIRAFLKHALTGVSDARDPKLMDHDHIAEAWMNVYHKNRLSKAYRMAYMKPDGKVFGVKKVGGKVETAEIGKNSEVIVRNPKDLHDYARFSYYYGW